MSFRLRLFSFLSFFLLALGVSAQQPSPGVRSQAVAGGRFVLVHTGSGRPVSAQRFDEVHPFSRGFAVVRIGARWGFVNGRGELVQPPAFDELSDFVESSTLARVGGNWKLVDTAGNIRRTFNAGWQPSVGSRQAHAEPPVSRVLTPHPELPARPATLSAGDCPFNLDFEAGNFTNWKCFQGDVESPMGVNNITVFPSAPINNQHTIVPHATPSRRDFYGGFPTNPPDGSQYAVRLGNDNVARGAERIRYVIHVPNPANEYSVRFQYAVVLENPDDASTGTPHDDYEQPRFTAKMFDSASGEFLPCASFTYVASLVPGFQLSPITTGGQYSSPAGAPIRYKPWSSVYVNLSRFAGRTLYFEFTTADCTLGGHFGYAYVDVSECGSAAKLTYDCAPPNPTLLEGPPGFQTYQWWNASFSQQLSTQQNFALNPGPPIGTAYWLVVKPFNNTDCNSCNCTDTLRVAANPVFPTATAGPDRVICETGSVTLGGGSAVPTNTYTWSPATGLLSPSSPTTIQNGSVGGSYVLTVTDTNHCVTRDTVDVTIQPKPVAGFTIANTALCAGDVFTFTNGSTVAAGTLSQLWYFGDGQTSTLANPTHTYATGGSYVVKLVTSTSGGCKDSLSLPITVYRKPTPLFTPNAQGQCITGNNFQFINGSTLSGGTFSGVWNFGDNSSSTVVNPTHSYAQPGTYPVTLVLTSDKGCIDSVRQNMVVDPIPTAAFNINTAGQCLNGNRFQFTDQSLVSIGTYSTVYNLGDGNTSTQGSPSYTYTAPGTYSVQLTVNTPNGCIHSITHPVTVYHKPVPVFTISNAAQCLRNNSFTFNSGSSIGAGSITLLWNLGDNNQSTQPGVTHTYAAAGTYTVQLLAVSDRGCKDSLRMPVVVHPMPQPAYTVNNAAQCLNGNNFVMTNASQIQGGTMTYQWSYSDGGTSASTSPAHSFANYGPYSIGMVATSDKGCIDSTRQAVMVHPKPMPAFVANTPQQCLRGNNYQFTGSGSIAVGNITSLWHFGDGSTSSLVHPSHVYTSAGSYSVRQVLTSDKGCKDSALLPVDVIANPTVRTGVSPRLQALCEGDSLQLNAQGASTYSWSPATALSCTNCATPKAAPIVDQTYYLIGYNSFGCPGEDTVQVSVKHPIQVTAAGITICSRVQGQLAAQGASTYSWSPATGLSDPASPRPAVILDSTQVYQLVGYDSVHCFTDTINVLVHVDPSPSVDLGPDVQLPTGSVLQLAPAIGNGPIISWTWTPARDLSCSNCPTPVASVHNDMLYVLKVVNNFGCKSSDTLRIGAFCKDAQLFVANAFTPNGDGVNDVLFPQALGIAKVKYFRIFNRWGELLFERTEFVPNDARYGWDGKIRGVVAPPDVFTWTAMVVCENKIEYTLKGNVSVIK
ncbi:MAG: PKD domain-containing protein [Chitinophagaceae bacterium]|nr:MAG: PKD domain-containing protein [Chitinophagaceae bacterium]